MRAFVVVIVGISLWAATQAVAYYDAGQLPQFSVYAVIALVGGVASVTAIRKIQKKMSSTAAIAMSSSVACSSCGWEITRISNHDDNVGKVVGQCRKCQGSMRVTSIFREGQQSQRPVVEHQTRDEDEEVLLY